MALMTILQGASMEQLPGLKDDTVLAGSESGQQVEL